MKGKNLWRLGISTVMAALLLGGCGNSEERVSENNTEAAPKETADLAESTGEQSEAAVDTPKYNVTWEDMAEIIVTYPSMNTIQARLPEVEAAINEITESEINTHVTLQMIEVGNYDQQINLMMSSGEQTDLMVTMPGGPASFATMTSQKQLKDITELLEEYAPTAVSEIGNLIAGTQINGRTFAFPAYKSFSAATYLSMRTDVLEDLGLKEKAENMTTLKEFEEIMEAVKSSEKWNYLAGISGADAHGAVLTMNSTVAYQDNFQDITYLDNLGDTLYTVAIRNDDNQVLNAFATEEFRHNYEIVKDWYDKGYVYKDSPTTQEMGSALVKSNAVFALSEYIELGSESSSSMNCGMPMTTVSLGTLPITTGSLTKFTWAVPQTAKEPEAALAFLEMMFTDSRVANLFAWGIEGVDYEVDDNGVAHYIEGNETPAYHTVSFLNANKFIVTPWEGEDPQMLAQLEEEMKTVPTSKYLGFVCNTTEITDEISAINNAIEQYKAQIISGTADEDEYNEFLAKLDDVGINTVVEAYQTQLDEWLASTK